ncbi:hypothetical protein [Paenibacillus chibensis]|uniref:hypothetical protein n=1 Tax=Paenibacillus chibensis TaxID=59846 RepID=UPI000FD870DB|nr:hypothetical protein [Paenibacillus chibensis]MEC0370626.1 hypothetical protein [Paenibacillus chibensis]
MENLYLYHYYEANKGPFKNLSSLTLKEAQSIMDALKTEENMFASRRSDDYLRIRLELEAKARNDFMQKGGKPKTMFPHYMTLGRCEWLKTWYAEGKEINIHIHEFKPDTLSFTYGDLFPTMRFKDGKPYREQVYTLHEIMNVIKQFGWPQEWNEDGSQGPERYIEVQVWDEKVINKHRSRREVR